MPNLGHVTSAALELSLAAQEGDLSTLGAVGLVSAQVRYNDDIVELTDRLVPVRQRAWELPTAPDRSVATLRDLATIAVAIHAHAAVFHASPEGLAAPLVTQGRRWRALSSKLAPMVSLMPHDPGIRVDLVASRTTYPLSLPSRVPVGPRAPTPTHDASVPYWARPSPSRQNSLSTVLERSMSWRARTTCSFPARTLTGDEITDDPDLVTARLHGALAPASRRQVDELAHLRWGG